ncbi:MAG: hypothetical protein ACRCSY_03590 [Cetobacterium sp.]
MKSTEKTFMTVSCHFPLLYAAIVPNITPKIDEIRNAGNAINNVYFTGSINSLTTFPEFLKITPNSPFVNNLPQKLKY